MVVGIAIPQIRTALTAVIFSAAEVEAAVPEEGEVRDGVAEEE
jgi:hypothetical protein